MYKLNKNEWIGVVVSISVVGFFFVFGQGLISYFNERSSLISDTSPKVSTKDEVLGIGSEAISGSRVTVHYTGRLVDGKVFDSSVTRGEPVQFVLGVGQVIEGWDKGIVGMRVGGVRVISIPPELGYGRNDYGPIPGNSTLVFEVQLLKVEK